MKHPELMPYIDNSQEYLSECPEWFTDLTGKLVLYIEAFDPDALDEHAFYFGPEDTSAGEEHLSDAVSCNEFLGQILEPAENSDYSIAIGAAENYHLIYKANMTCADAHRIMGEVETKLREALPEGILKIVHSENE